MEAVLQQIFRSLLDWANGGVLLFSRLLLWMLVFAFLHRLVLNDIFVTERFVLVARQSLWVLPAFLLVADWADRRGAS